MRESEATYYGADEEEEKRLVMSAERSPAAEHRLKTGTGGMHPCISRAMSGRHILLIGSTGSGKTYAASYMARFMDSFIFINTQEELSASRECQILLEDPEDLQEALEEGYRGIEYVPSMGREDAIEEVEVIREQLFEIGSEMKGENPVLELQTWITVFLDETQIYAPIMTHKEAENFWNRGRGYGIRGVAISRQPQELSKDVVNNCEFELIFQLGHYALPYFQRFKIPIEEHQAWINRKWHFLLYDKRQIFECVPVK
jgi:energy-coupling factor transporter ATP-binding protein EcfA2